MESLLILKLACAAPCVVDLVKPRSSLAPLLVSSLPRRFLSYPALSIMAPHPQLFVGQPMEACFL